MTSNWKNDTRNGFMHTPKKPYTRGNTHNSRIGARYINYCGSHFFTISWKLPKVATWEHKSEKKGSYYWEKKLLAGLMKFGLHIRDSKITK